VELFVTKKQRFPAALNLARIAGIPLIKESPRQITPSQSKIKISVLDSSVTSGFVRRGVLTAVERRRVDKIGPPCDIAKKGRRSEIEGETRKFDAPHRKPRAVLATVRSDSALIY